MKRTTVGIIVLTVLFSTAFVFFSNKSNIKGTSVKANEQTDYEQKLQRSVEKGLQEYDVVHQVMPWYYETMVIFNIQTTINGNDAKAKKFAGQIKNKVDDIVLSKKIKTHYKHYFIAIYNANGEDLVTRSKDGSLKKDIKNIGTIQTEKLPQEYTQEQALKNGDILMKNRTKKQKEKIKQFKRSVIDGKPDFIRFTRFTSSGAAVLTEYHFNGQMIYYRYDSSRDKSGVSDILEDYCKELVTDSEMSYITQCYKNHTLEF
ncbi:hypothetical protein AM500_18955 [Bacillus sp. FJAT-18017]|uniref:DUF4362 domain-containing protein n=1 Tax=Bacillus sp. FJAT-18017 TaxID=1705566 RepID=UPI0006ADB23C|nr:DUF4362 domain-containing protein [Bacillus sp. FJAT-18017]ALC91633.1 hypothetical protein AM500_18955 [Bacillus sp. FJAT-18017]